jgi:PHD/YefM family antitoxin component YafN of YafNO toxin-antitoxin module
MLPAERHNPEYVTDAEGHKRAVILPIEEYQELMEDLDDLAAIAERREEPTIPHEKVMEELRRDGYVSD